MKKNYGMSRNLTFKYNQLLSEEMDRRKSQNGSRGEMIEKTKGSK